MRVYVIVVYQCYKTASVRSSAVRGGEGGGVVTARVMIQRWSDSLAPWAVARIKKIYIVTAVINAFRSPAVPESITYVCCIYII